jgi:hypothetical protein
MKIVHYDKSRGLAFTTDKRAMVYPIDHPDTYRVSNTTIVTTSEVAMHDPASGVFLTRNSLYIPV